ncbi:MAG: TadE/TadG family type IV pilus assembly protein [Chloroflexota bacterium]
MELSLVLPILAMVLLVSLDLGRAYFAYVGVLAAAENGVRVAADPGKSEAEIKAAVVGEPDGSLAISTGDVTVSSPRSPGGEVTVTVQYPFMAVTPFVGNLLGSATIDIEVSAKGVVL